MQEALPRAGFLCLLGKMDVLAWVIIAYWGRGCITHCWVFGGTPGLSPRDASSTLLL